MPAVILFDDFVDSLARKRHDLSADTFRVALTNVAPDQAADAVLADITQISNAGGYAPAIVTLPWAETAAGSGIWQLGDGSADYSYVPVGASFDAFQWVVLYNDSSTDDRLIGYIAYPSAITLAVGQAFDIDAGTNGWVRLPTPRP